MSNASNPRSGYRTTEALLAFLIALLGALPSSGLLATAPPSWVQAVGLISSALTTIAYVHNRTRLKHAHVMSVHAPRAPEVVQLGRVIVPNPVKPVDAVRATSAAETVKSADTVNVTAPTTHAASALEVKSADTANATAPTTHTTSAPEVKLADAVNTPKEGS